MCTPIMRSISQVTQHPLFAPVIAFFVVLTMWLTITHFIPERVIDVLMYAYFGWHGLSKVIAWTEAKINQKVKELFDGA